MQPKHLQQLITRQRKELSILYCLQNSYKRYREEGSSTGNTPVEYMAHNALQRICKDIKRRVEIQKALKNELHKQIDNARRSRRAAKVVDAVKMACGECYE